MKTKFGKTIAGVALLFCAYGAGGCHGDLDIMQDNKLSASNMWKEESDATSATYGLYVYLRSALKSMNDVYLCWGELRNGLWGPGTHNTLNGVDQSQVRTSTMSSVNEYADWTRPFVHTNGNLGADSIAPIRVPTLDSVYVAVLQNKVAEMKETAGNRDVMSGGTAGGVTAATAIAALQEAGGKLSRNMIDDGYQAFAQVMTLCIELVRQFYSAPRQFRLLGRGAEREFRMFDNGGMQPKALALGGYRVPEFDLEIAAQDETPYKTMEYNQLALQLFQMGFFRADMAEQALRCLELMEFKNKDQLASVIRQGQQRTRQVAWLQRQLLTAVQLLDAKQGTSLAQALEQEMNGGEAPDVGAVKAGSAPDAMERQRKQSREAVRPR